MSSYIDNTTARAATSNATTTNNIFSNRVRLPQAEFENVGPLCKENKKTQLRNCNCLFTNHQKILVCLILRILCSNNYVSEFKFRLNVNDPDRCKQNLH